MFLGGIITSIFWAIVLAILLWILCAFSGRLVNVRFRMTPLLHVLCFVITIPTVVLLVVAFTCNTINRKITQMETDVAKILIADRVFVEQLQRQITLALSSSDTGKLTNYLAENFTGRISSEYPILKYLDVTQLLEKTDVGKTVSGFFQGADATGVSIGKVQQVVQEAVGRFTDVVRSKVKKVRQTVLIATILLQAIAFGAVFYRASRYRSPVQSSFPDRSNDYL